MRLNNLNKSFNAIVSGLLKGTVACIAMSIHATSPSDSIRYCGELRATFSGGENTPFWLMNNLQGLGSPEKNNGYIRGAMFKDLDKDKRFSWGAGVDLVGGWRQTSDFSIHQLYGEIKYRSVDFLIGSKEIWGDYNNPRLSSGGLLYSGNAMPVPQIRIGIFDYAPFWGTKGWFSMKGYIAYGFFTDSSWQKSWAAPESKYNIDVLYHSKGLWIKGGNTEKFPLEAEVGIEMATQFGGKAFENGKVINLKPSFKDWLKAFFPTQENMESLKGETSSIMGNMLGQYTIALSWQPHSDWSVRGYYEHYFEDQSQMTFEYGWKDGLWGIDVELPRNPVVSEVVYEYLRTKDQTGAVYNDKSPNLPEQVSGRDDYYNHMLYSGWQHWGMGIGNPLIISPIYNNDHLIRFSCNRIIAHHFAIAGQPSPSIDYRILASYSRNWGTYTRPTPEVLKNFNFLAEVTWHPRKLKGWYATVGFAADRGALLGKSFGGELVIGKTGYFSFNKNRKRK